MQRPAFLASGLAAAVALAALTPPPKAAPARLAVGTAAFDRHGDVLPSAALARLGTVRFRGPLAAAPQPAALATLRGNRAVVVDMDGGRLLCQYPGPDAVRFPATSFLLSPDGRSVAYGGEDRLEVYDTASGQLRVAWPGDVSDEESEAGNFQPIAFLADGSRLLVQRQSAAGYVECFDRTTGQRRWRLGQAFPSDERTYQVAGVRAVEPAVVIVRPHANDAAAWLVSSATGDLVAAFPVCSDERIAAAAVSPDGSQLAVADPDHAIRLYELATGREIRSFAAKPGWLNFDGGQYHVVTFSRDGQHLAAIGELGVSVFTVATGRQLFHHGSRAFSGIGNYAGVFSADGRALWVHHYDSAAWRRFDLPSGREQKSPDHGHRAHVHSVAITSDGKLAATAAGDEAARLWDTRSGRVIRRLSSGGLFSLGVSDLLGFRALAFSPDGTHLAGLTSSLGGNGLGTKLVLWDINGRVKRTYTVPGETFGEGNVVAFSPDGRQIAIPGSANAGGPNGPDHAIYLYDIAAAKGRKAIAGLPDDPTALSFSPDGRRLLVANRYSDDGAAVIVYDVASGQPWRTGPDNVTAATFLPYGELVVFAADDRLAVWELASGEERLTLPLPPGEIIDALAVSPEGRWVAGVNVGSGSRRVHVWDLQCGTELPALVGHDQVLMAVAFARDGRLISGSQDTTALVWQLRADGRPSPAKGADAAWADLAAGAAAASGTIESLVANPSAALPLISSRLRPAKPIDPNGVERLLARLDSRRYLERQSAAAELITLDRQAEPFLRRYRDAAPSSEAASRADALLARLSGQAVSPERLREIRAVEVLARIGTPEAQQQLRQLAAGDPAARLTEMARTALGVAVDANAP